MQPEDKAPEPEEVSDDQIEDTTLSGGDAVGGIDEPIEEVMADLRAETAKADTAPPENERVEGKLPDEPTPNTPQREVGWTVIVGLESQQIKMGGSPIYTRIASVHVRATTPEKAAMEARLALTRAVEGTESDHWHAVLVFIGHQEAIPI